MKKVGSLRRRWFWNTSGVVFALGIVCVLAVTAVFAAHYYTNLEASLQSQNRTVTGVFSDNTAMDEALFMDACISYVQGYTDEDGMALQLTDTTGKLLACSVEAEGLGGPTQEQIREAVESRGITSYLGTDPLTGRRVLTVAGPMITGSGEVVGVLRHVKSTVNVDTKIVLTAIISFAVMVMVLAVVSLTSNYCLQSVMMPVADITEKAKRIANGSYGAQIRTKYHDEIGELADTVNELSTKISQNEKMQAEFISSLSHELRTPLTAINGWSETLLSDDQIDQETRRGLKIIAREASRLTEMVVDLLDFTRMQDGRMTLTVEPTDIRSEFEDTVFMYGNRLSQEGIQLDYIDNDDEIPEIPCDPKRLRQVLLNILDNAAKHGGEGKRIEASIQSDGESVVIQIRDYGCGIPEDELPLVKKKFYKGSSKARGTGIGLAVCDEIVEMHGGMLTLDNAPGGGTVVTVRLPVAQ